MIHVFTTLHSIKGVVKHYSEIAGEGLIIAKDGAEYAVYSKGLKNCVYVLPGDKVEFRREEGHGANVAVEVQKIYE